MAVMTEVGGRKRLSFSKIDEVLEVPNLIEIQKHTYEWFKEEGLDETFRDISPIQDFTGNLVLEFVSHKFDPPKYSVEECKQRDVTYAASLKAKVRLINRETGEVKEQEVYMGDFPLMTEKGTFVINGAERVVVSQLVRSRPECTMILRGILLVSAYIQPVLSPIEVHGSSLRWILRNAFG
jgi:DNA-directed RNA polymerase subunit beta